MDLSLTIWFNAIAKHLTGVLPLFSDWIVYAIFGFGALWIAVHHLGRFRYMVIDSMYTLATPIFFSAVLSESLSKLISRDRPFVASKEITQLIEHGADASFPSSHMSVMVAMAVALWYRNHVLGYLTFTLAIFSGLARIGAGLHYPSDILVGLLIGLICGVATHKFTKEARLRALRS